MFSRFKNKSFNSDSRKSFSLVTHWTFWEFSKLTRITKCLFSLYFILYLSDIAVGAPYEEGTGAVYIYNGNTPKLEDKYSQRILGRNIRVGLSGFGFYISKFGEDLDENRYNGNF